MEESSILPELPTHSSDDFFSAKGPQVPCTLCLKQCAFVVYSNEDRSIVIGNYCKHKDQIKTDPMTRLASNFFAAPRGDPITHNRSTALDANRN